MPPIKGSGAQFVEAPNKCNSLSSRGTGQNQYSIAQGEREGTSFCSIGSLEVFDPSLFGFWSISKGQKASPEGSLKKGGFGLDSQGPPKSIRFAYQTHPPPCFVCGEVSPALPVLQPGAEGGHVTWPRDCCAKLSRGEALQQIWNLPTHKSERISGGSSVF